MDVTLYLSPEIALHSWSSEYVVYDRANGDTRLLDHMAGGIVELLSMQDQSQDMLSRTLRSRESHVPEEEWSAEFEACVANLLALDIIRTSPNC